ncbi:MAG: SIS domain-containing protein [Armatimonadota bacterium]
MADQTDPVERIVDSFEYSAEVMNNCAKKIPKDIAAAVRVLTACLRAGGTVAFAGNGGSAAQAQHLAGELVGRYLQDRRAYRSVALTTDTSILTAVGNDFGYEQIFARQVQGLLEAGDVLVVMSTSGNSPNILRAVQQAKSQGIKTIGLTGSEGGALKDEADWCIRVPEFNTPKIQEAHLAIGHILCELVEEAMIEIDEGA